MPGSPAVLAQRRGQEPRASARQPAFGRGGGFRLVVWGSCLGFRGFRGVSGFRGFRGFKV